MQSSKTSTVHLSVFQNENWEISSDLDEIEQHQKFEHSMGDAILKSTTNLNSVDIN